jgi:hypothetical protein
MTYVQRSPAIPPPRIWTSSLHDTVHQVLHPLLYSAVLAPAAVWAAGALVLPTIGARGDRAVGPWAWVPRVVLLMAWAGGIALATAGVLAAAAPGLALRSGPVLLGMLSCSVLAGLTWPAGLRRPSVSSSDAGPGLA